MVLFWLITGQASRKGGRVWPVGMVLFWLLTVQESQKGGVEGARHHGGHHPMSRSPTGVFFFNMHAIGVELWVRCVLVWQYVSLDTRRVECLASRDRS